MLFCGTQKFGGEVWKIFVSFGDIEIKKDWAQTCHSEYESIATESSGCVLLPPHEPNAAEGGGVVL